MSDSPTPSTLIDPAAAGRGPFGDRWIVVSGASSGIGRAISLGLVAEGARVVLIGRDEARLAETARLAGPSERSLVCRLDLADLNAIGPALKALVPHTGRLYGLCHAAGASMTLPLSATRPDRVRPLMDLNLHAGLELCRAIADRSVVTENGASLLWISSVAAHAGAPGQIAYCASKGAVCAAVRAMALELAPRGFRVNSISPGMVVTEMSTALSNRLSAEQMAKIRASHPLGPGQPEDVARAASFLLNPLNAWITGTDMVVDGGYLLN